MSSATHLELSATAAARLIAAAYEKHLPENERGNFVNDLRESIRKAAKLSAIEVGQELREQMREHPEMGDGRRPAKRESLATGCDPAAPDFLDRCRNLARLVLARDGMPPTTPPWTGDAAEFVLTALIAFVAACEPQESQRNLLNVRKILAAPEVYSAAIRTMQHEGQGDLIRRLGQQLTWLHEYDRSPVMLTLLLRTAWMESAAAARLASPDFELRRLPLDRGRALLASARDGRGARWRRLRSWLAGLTGTRLQPKPLEQPTE